MATQSAQPFAGCLTRTDLHSRTKGPICCAIHWLPVCCANATAETKKLSGKNFPKIARGKYSRFSIETDERE